MSRFAKRLVRFGLMAVLPIAAAAGAAAYAYDRSPVPATKYRATVVVQPPTVFRDSAAAVNLFIADLSERVTSDAVVGHVLGAVPGLDEASYRTDIAATRRGVTSSVELAMTHAEAEVAKSTVEGLAVKVLDDAARGEFERMQFLLDRASDRLVEAEAGLNEFFRTEALFDPELEYRNALSEIAELDQQITTGQALSYGETYLSQLAARREELQRSLPRLGEAMLIYQRLTNELETAQEAWEVAVTDYDLAEFEYRVLNAPDRLIVRRTIERFADETPRLQTTALWGAVGLTLGLFLFIPLAIFLTRSSGKHEPQVEHRRSETIDLSKLAKENPEHAFHSARDLIVQALLTGEKAGHEPAGDRGGDRDR